MTRNCHNIKVKEFSQLDTESEVNSQHSFIQQWQCYHILKTKQRSLKQVKTVPFQSDDFWFFSVPHPEANF